MGVCALGAEELGDEMTDENKRAVQKSGANFPRLRVKGLLILMTVGSFVSIFFRAGAYLALFFSVIVILPIVVAFLLTLFCWSSPRTPMRLLNWGLLAILPVAAIMAAKEIVGVVDGVGAAIVVVLIALLVLALIWFPQVAGVLVYFHVPAQVEVKSGAPFD